MMWGNGFGMGGGWLWGGLMMLLFWAVVIGLIVWAFWALTRSQRGRANDSNNPRSAATEPLQGDRALQIARERYACGEISREQYDDIRQTLGV